MVKYVVWRSQNSGSFICYHQSWTNN